MPATGPLTVRQLPGEFGAAEVEGLDPRAVADESTHEQLRETLWEHRVVCIRFKTPLDDVDARATASMIGPIKDPIGRTRDGSTLRYSEDRQVICSTPRHRRV